MATTTHRMTLDEFLALPETEPASEFICGEVIQKPMPTYFHGLLQMALGALFITYFARTGEGEVVSETRNAHRPEQRSYVPDVSVYLRVHVPTDSTRRRGPVERHPDIAIEILSPDDRPGRVAEKLAFYLRVGVPLVWIVNPDDRTLDAHRPGAPSTSHRPPETVTAGPVLPDFKLDLAQLFAVLDGPAAR